LPSLLLPVTADHLAAKWRSINTDYVPIGALEMMNSIQNTPPLKSTCGVCGKPISNLSMIPIGDGNNCKLCNQSICDQHFSKSRNTCSRCEKGTDSWCTTPKSKP
jgi:hypothetical protein